LKFVYINSSFAQFDFTSTGITNFRTNGYREYFNLATGIVNVKSYVFLTLCFRMAACPDDLPFFYRSTTNLCYSCSNYQLVNGTTTLPQYCEQLFYTSPQVNYYYNYTNSLTYVCIPCEICSNLSYLDAGICYKCDKKYPFCVYCN
jgi:hypothetical protein